MLISLKFILLKLIKNFRQLTPLHCTNLPYNPLPIREDGHCTSSPAVPYYPYFLRKYERSFMEILCKHLSRHSASLSLIANFEAIHISARHVNTCYEQNGIENHCWCGSWLTINSQERFSYAFTELKYFLW